MAHILPTQQVCGHAVIKVLKSFGCLLTFQYNIGMTYSYHQTFAWLPTRMDSGAWVWLNPYYIRPNTNGEGVLLSRMEYILESRLD